MGGTGRDYPTNTKQAMNCGIAAKLAHADVSHVTIDIDTHPYFTSRAGGTKLDRSDDRVIVDTNLLHAKAQYGGLGVSAAASAKVAVHRKVSVMQYGVARMY